MTNEISRAARKGTAELMNLLRRSAGFKKTGLLEKERAELAFHLAEIVVDVQAFLDSRTTAQAWSTLVRHLSYHWPYHERKARRLAAKATREPKTAVTTSTRRRGAGPSRSR